MVANDYEREICDGVLCGLSLLLVLAFSWPCCEGFPLGTGGFPPAPPGPPPPPPKKSQYFEIPVGSGMVDQEQPRRFTTI